MANQLKNSKHPVLWSSVIVVWLACVTLGMFMIEHAGAAPGEIAPAPVMWPSASALTIEHNRPQLLMFVHPMCPCSQASISELERIVTRTKDHAAFTVVIVLPNGADSEWESAASVERVRAMPSVTTYIDHGGVEAARFGARTSGHVLIYDSAQKLTYCGGITGARGHEGPNRGADRVLSSLLHESSSGEDCCTYGCPLQGAKERP